ncbi:uncharacterized protein VP01_7825g1 [Puccinia sorghi]|uniref:Uncharacterized protein n=1 Tax=Puccinia sorghi TaxID=27349 RepID=A0A0L6UD72_9BASI|nr:uncharacterized protein VP01_7825g1 [Puccinia sorghi]
MKISQIKKQEAAPAEVWNHLISIEASQNASTSRRRNQEDLNDPTLDSEDTTNLYMENLYQAHQPNLKHGLRHWYNSGTDGVSISSPPSSLQFVNLSSKKRKINHETSGSNYVGQLLVNLLTSKNKVGSPSPSDGSQSSDSEVGTTAMIDDIASFKLFKSKNITQDHMSRWGLSYGIIAQSRDNVLKYKKSLNHPKF